MHRESIALMTYSGSAEVTMPNIHARLLSGWRTALATFGGMSADVKHQALLKCFRQTHARISIRDVLARLVEIALGRAADPELCPVRQESPGARSPFVLGRSYRQVVPAEFVC